MAVDTTTDQELGAVPVTAPAPNNQSGSTDDLDAQLGAVPVSAPPTPDAASSNLDAELGAVPVQPTAQSTSTTDAELGAVPVAPPTPPPPTANPSNQGGILTRAPRPLLNDDDVQAIAAKSGADPDFIRRVAPYYGLWRAEAPSVQGTLEGLAGGLNTIGTGGLAGDIVKKFGFDDSQRKAVDEIERLQHERRSYMEGTGAFIGSVLPFEAVGSLGAKAATAVAGDGAATVGRWLAGLPAAAGFGAVQTDEGHEAVGAALGAATFVGLPLIGKAVGAGYAGVKGLVGRKSAEAIADWVGESVNADALEAAWSKAEPAETALADHVINNPYAQSFGDFVASAPDGTVERIAQLYPEGKFAPPSYLEAAVNSELGLTTPEAETAAKAYSVVTEARTALARKLGAGRATEGLEGAVAQSPEVARDSLTALRRSQYLAEQLKANPDLFKFGDIGPIQRAWMFAADGRYVYQLIDSKFGTELSPLVDSLSTATNSQTVAVSSALKQLKPLVRQFFRCEDQTPSGMQFREAAWDMLDSGDFRDATANQRQYLQGMRDYFQTQADTVEQLHEMFPQTPISPITIARRLEGEAQSYIPHYTVDPEEMTARLQDRIDEARTSGIDLLNPEPDAQDWAEETIRGLEIHWGGSITDQASLNDAIIGLKTQRLSMDAVRARAASLLARNGEIPDFIMERDTLRLAQRWVNGMYRYAFTQKPLSQLSSAADALNDISPTIAKYIRNHVSDLLGSRQGTWASGWQSTFDRLRVWATDKAEQSNNPATAWMYRTVGGLDDLIREQSSNLYTYYLGLRADNAARNLAQGLTQTVPNMGDLADGTRRVMAAYSAAAKTALTQAEGGVFQQLQTRGLLPNFRLYEAQQALTDVIKSQSPLAAAASSVTEGASRLAMSLYTGADAAARYVTMHVADGVAADAVRGSQSAMSHLMAVGPGYDSAIRRALAAGDERQVADLYAKFLVSKSQHQYNRAAMSEFGRYAGWMFSMFSKWPTAVIGELGGFGAAALESQRAIPNAVRSTAVKYVMPLIGLSLAQDWWADARQDHPVAAALAGQDLRRLALGGIVAQLAGGDVVHLPPALSMLGKSVKGVGNGDPLAPLAALGDFAIEGTPGAYFAKFMLETGPQTMGQEPIVPMSGGALTNWIRQESPVDIPSGIRSR